MLRFTFRRPTGVEVSTCCHRPSGGDIDGCIDVCVSGVSASTAPEDRLALAILRCTVPADGARLAGVGGGDLFYSAGCFVLEALNELAPAGGQYAAVESCLLTHVPARFVAGAARGCRHGANVEVLNADQVVLACEMGRQLLDPVLATVGVEGADSGDLCTSAAKSIRGRPATDVLAGGSFLQPPEPFAFTQGQARNLVEVTVGGCYCNLHATVDPDHFAVPRGQNGRRDGGKSDVPATGTISRDSIGRRIRERLRQAKPHPADFWNEYARPLSAQDLGPAGLGTDDPETVMGARLSPGWAPVSAGKEVPPGLVEIPQRLLLHRLGSRGEPRLGVAGLRQLGALRRIPRCRGSSGAPHQSLLKAQVPGKPRLCTVRGQAVTLRAGRNQTKPHEHNLDPGTDNDMEGRERRCVAGLRSGYRAPRLR